MQAVRAPIRSHSHGNPPTGGHPALHFALKLRVFQPLKEGNPCHSVDFITALPDNENKQSTYREPGPDPESLNGRQRVRIHGAPPNVSESMGNAVRPMGA